MNHGRIGSAVMAVIEAAELRTLVRIAQILDSRNPGNPLSEGFSASAGRCSSLPSAVRSQRLRSVNDGLRQNCKSALLLRCAARFHGRVRFQYQLTSLAPSVVIFDEIDHGQPGTFPDRPSAQYQQIPCPRIVGKQELIYIRPKNGRATTISSQLFLPRIIGRSIGS
jgi:hypothetical protein